MIITRKIELYIEEPDKDKKNETWKYLNKLNHDVFRASNLIVSNQYFNEAFVQRIILTDEALSRKAKKADEEIKKLTEAMKMSENDEAKEKLKVSRDKVYKAKNSLTKEARLKAEEFYTTGEQNSTYQLLGISFPEMSSYIKKALNYEVYNSFKNELFDVQRGTRSIRSYKKGMPISFIKESMRFKENDGEIFMHWLDDITFKLNFGKDKSDNKTIVKRAMAGDYKYLNSSIRLKDKKIFLQLVVDIPNGKTELDSNLSVGVDLGISVPAYCALSEGYARLSIGNKEDLLKARLQMQSRRRRLQRAMKLTGGGKGRTKKLKALESLTEKERNYVKTYNHMISHNIVKFAKDNRAATIKLELLEGFGDDEKNKFILRNWSYHELQTMIEYKATQFGITITNIDPYHTSQTCAVCGHYEEGQRETQAVFKCKNPECKNFHEKLKEKEQINADYNAALNIAKSTIFVTRKEDCQYFKKQLPVL